MTSVDVDMAVVLRRLMRLPEDFPADMLPWDEFRKAARLDGMVPLDEALKAVKQYGEYVHFSDDMPYGLETRQALAALAGLGDAATGTSLDCGGARVIGALAHKGEARTAPAVPERPQGHAKPTGDTRGVA